ncbi:YhcH/YjgK/YiaL family protein [uncultured Oscillibacter sp.]|uniref:YhcH/YjgK/YiaL family protein n=1 Tax=uncultured Oscillibacter sp. TaxID=876091 RepID=UPI003417BA93
MTGLRPTILCLPGPGALQADPLPGNFLVVFPGDAHRIKMQLGGPETVSKVVLKVRIFWRLRSD